MNGTGGIVDVLAILSERDEIYECKEHIFLQLSYV